MSIGKKAVAEYKKNPEYRKLFDFPDFIEEMILVDNGYGVEIPMARFDIFYNGADDFQFCEINTDGSSAMNEDNVIAEMMLQMKSIKDMKKDYQFSYFELFDSWVAESLEIYKKYDPTNRTPNVAILDFNESITENEFVKFKEAYERVGLNCEIVDPRELKYTDGKLYFGDFKIDMIYRRLVTYELIEKKDQAEEFIKAYLDGAVCTIGSIESQIIHNKIFFKIMHDEETKVLLSPEEVEFIEKHVPFTGLFGGDESVFEEVKQNREKYILKPTDKNAGQGVFEGQSLSQEEWEHRLEESFNNDYLYQEFIPHKVVSTVHFDENGEVSVRELGNMAGLFMYNEKLAGLYVRLGSKPIIAGIVESFTSPGILAVRRNMDDILPRINELANKKKTADLDEAETEELDKLRKEYILRFRAGMKNTLLNVKVVDEEGNDVTALKLKKLHHEKLKDI
ncbi:MAG: DUF896 domain-containing protein [Tissierellia bacterium]|nr:DUF896 domain-containing protein [Tissierellia bacterium]